MKRYDIINRLIEQNNYKSYLEIGTQGFKCMNAVKCDLKVGVDPKPLGNPVENSVTRFYELTSDEYFKRMDLYHSFDIIFIDGLHHHQQVVKDVNNALSWMDDKGVIIIHDCHPLTEMSQRVPYEHTSTWNGDVWRAWLHFRNRKDLKMFVVDTDEGCGIMQWGKQEPIDVRYMSVRFDEFIVHKKEWLNLITTEQYDNL